MSKKAKTSRAKSSPSSAAKAQDTAARRVAGELISPPIPGNVLGQMQVTPEDLRGLQMGDDVIKVMISQGRKRLNEEIRKSSELRKELNGKIEDLRKKAQGKATAAAETFCRDKAKALVKTLNTICDKAKWTFEFGSASLALYGPEADKKEREHAKQLVATVRFYDDNNSTRHGGFSLDFNMETPTECLDLLDERVKCYTTLKEAEERNLQLLKSLSELPQYREELEAKLAAERLGSNPDSQALIDKLARELETDLRIAQK